MTAEETIRTDLAPRAWKLFETFRENPCVVRNSIPILYFGSLTEYLASPIKVVTVGKNPSSDEFPSGNTFQRFQAFEMIILP